MSNYNIIYSSQATRNLQMIVNYIKNVLLSPQAARSFRTSLKEKEIIIAKNPHIYQEEYFGKHIYRKAMVNRYIIAFRIDEQTHTVHIVAIGHSLQKRKNIVKQ